MNTNSLPGNRVFIDFLLQPPLGPERKVAQFQSVAV